MTRIEEEEEEEADSMPGMGELVKRAVKECGWLYLGLAGELEAELPWRGT